MRIGIPPNSVNCFEGCAFFDRVSMALGTGAIRVPSPAAGMMTTTFMAGGQYTSAHAGVQMGSPKVKGLNHEGHEGSRRIFIPKGFLRVTSCPLRSGFFHIGPTWTTPPASSRPPHWQLEPSAWIRV